MKKNIEKIKNELKEPLQNMNVIIDNVEFKEEGNYNFLTITLDKMNGLDLDTIVTATKVINPIIDKMDLGDDSFILDIISKEKGDR